MPLVRISLIKGKSPAYIRAIADGIHAALVEAYSVPLDDRFQIIEEVEQANLIYDRGYLGVSRSDDIVIVNIVASNWRDTQTKQGFYKRAAAILHENTGLRPEDLQIILSPNEREDWSFGNGVAAYVTS